MKIQSIILRHTCRLTYYMSVYYAGFFGDVLTCGLRGEGRRDWEVDLRYGVKRII